MVNIGKLPNIYHDELKHYNTNNNTIYYCTPNNKIEKEKIDINSFLNNMNKESGYIFNKNVIIKTNNYSYNTYIYKYDNKYVYTIDNNNILIDDIISIEKRT